MSFTKLFRRNSTESLDPILESHGDLLFDLCESLLLSSRHAHYTFRGIVKRIRRAGGVQKFADFERAWLLRIACEELRVQSRRHPRRLSAPEQLDLDSSPDVADKLRRFDGYFMRLSTDERLLLLLRDKYGLPFPEIATALGTPEGSLKVQRAHALRALEEWIWNGETSVLPPTRPPTQIPKTRGTRAL